MARKERISLIKKIQEKRNSKLFCYITSDRKNAGSAFAKDILPIFSEHLKNNKYENIDVFLFTLGGDTLAAFGLNKLLREHAKKLNALIPEKCLSAGTLFALGCDQILMTKVSYLGPIDPSINRPLNPAVNINGQVQNLPLSVESVAGFKGLVKDDWGIKKASDLSLILKLLSEKVHPLALGDVYRVRQQIELLATNLLKLHRNDHRKIQNIVKKLTKELGSHDYLIFRKEAKELIEEQIIIDNEIENLIRELYADFMKDLELGKPFMPDLIISSTPAQKNPNGQKLPRTAKVELKLAVIESEERGDHFIERKNLTEVHIQEPHRLPMKGVQQEVFSIGWEEY